MKKKLIFLTIVIIIFSVVFFTGCSSSSKNKSFEFLKSLFNSKPDYLEDRSFPDIPVYPGSSKIFYLETPTPEGSEKGAKVASVVYQVQEEPIEIIDFYVSEMAQYGWQKKLTESKAIKKSTENYFIVFTKGNTVSQINILGEKRVQSSVIQIAFFGEYKKIPTTNLYVNPFIKAWRSFMSLSLWTRYASLIFFLGAFYFIFGSKLLYYKIVIFKEVIFYSTIIVIYSSFYFFFIRKIEQASLDKSIFISLGFLVLVIVSFIPLRHILLKLIEGIFFREEYRYRNFLEKFNQLLSSLYDLDSFSGKIIQTIADVIKLQSISLFLYDEDKNEFKLLALSGFIYAVSGNMILKKKADPSLNKWEYTGDRSSGLIWQTEEKDIFSKNKFFISMIEIFTEKDRHIHENVISIPLRSKDKLVGLLNLGRKKSKHRFNSEDLRFFTTIADQIGVALENAKLYQDALDKCSE